MAAGERAVVAEEGAESLADMGRPAVETAGEGEAAFMFRRPTPDLAHRQEEVPIPSAIGRRRSVDRT